MISDEEIAELSKILTKMQEENNDTTGGEVADKAFHMLIARATRNSAIESIIDDLWNMRVKSELTNTMYKTVRTVGVKPSIQEHVDIYEALKERDPVAARRAMRTHLSRVIDTMFRATEIEAVEEAKRKISRDRERFTLLLKTS
jgi:DNA-binding FadR family transcriptional regulator